MASRRLNTELSKKWRHLLCTTQQRAD